MKTPFLTWRQKSRLLRWFLWGFFGALVVLALIAGIGLVVSSYIKKQAVNKAPTYSATQLYASAVQQIDQGHFEIAEQYLEQALLKEDDATYRNQLAVVKYRLKKYDEAVQNYQLLIKARKDVAFAWNGIGNAYRDWAGQPAGKALEAYAEARKADPRYVAAYSNAAILLVNTGKKEEGLALLDEGSAATNGAELERIKAALSEEVHE